MKFHAFIMVVASFLRYLVMYSLTARLGWLGNTVVGGLTYNDTPYEMPLGEDFHVVSSRYMLTLPPFSGMREPEQYIIAHDR